MLLTFVIGVSSGFVNVVSVLYVCAFEGAQVREGERERERGREKLTDFALAT